MRVLLSLFLVLFSIFAFAQAPLSIRTAPRRLASADIPTRTGLAGEHDQTINPLQQQPTSTNSMDAPSAVAQPKPSHSTCSKNNGKPCPEWLQKIIGQNPPIRVREEWDGEPDSFFTVGDGRRALHPDKKSWMWFVLGHGAMWATTVAAVRNYPASNQPANSAYPAAAAITGFDLLVFKTVSPAISLAPPVSAMVVYSRAASK